MSTNIYTKKTVQIKSTNVQTRIKDICILFNY